MANNSYVVSIFCRSFSSLEEAKWNLKVGLTRIEALKYLRTNDCIDHYIGDKLHSITPIHVDESGNITFGRTRKL